MITENESGGNLILILSIRRLILVLRITGMAPSLHIHPGSLPIESVLTSVFDFVYVV